MGTSESTLSRELKRNSRPRAGYEAKKAQEFAQKRRAKKPFKIKGELEKTIREQLEDEWSPEQIVGRMEVNQVVENCQTVSIETVYQYVYRRQKQGDKIYVKLRRKHRKRRKRLKKGDGRGKIPNKTMIDKRPKIVDAKDWASPNVSAIGRAILSSAKTTNLPY